MVHDRSQSSNDDVPPAKGSCIQQSHTASLSTAQAINQSAESSNHSAELFLNQTSNRAEKQSANNAVNLLTYAFLLPLVADCLSDRDVVARLLIVNKSIRRMMPKYGFKQVLPTDQALRIMRASRDVTFSVTRIQRKIDMFTFLNGATEALTKQLNEVHRENSAPLTEAHFEMPSHITFDRRFVIPHFVTHLICNGYSDISVPVDSIPSSVVELDLGYSVPSVGSIPSSVKQLTMTMNFSDLDLAVVPITVTDLRLIQADDSRQDHSEEIRCIFPSSLTHLNLGSYDLPIAPGIIPSSVLKLECSSELLSKLEIGAIPNSVTEMKIKWNMRYVPREGVIPDSVTHIDMISHAQHPQDIPPWPMPAHLTDLKMKIYPFSSITAGIVPATVTHFECNCQIESGALPSSITHLQMILINSRLIVGIIPHSVTHLNLLRGRSQPAILKPGFIPSSVTHLVFACSNKQKMVPGVIPDSVTHLTFNDHFNQHIPTGVIPQSVTHLVFGSHFDQSLDVINVYIK